LYLCKWEKDLVRWVQSNGNFFLKPSLSNGSFVLGSSLSLKDLFPSKLTAAEKKAETLSDGDAYRMWKTVKTNNRLVRTTAGYLGWVPRWCMRTDKVGLLAGCSVPVILRRRSSEGYWIVGASYFVDLTDGEAMKLGIPPLASWPAIKFF
jgi:hypothetical protein